MTIIQYTRLFVSTGNQVDCFWHVQTVFLLFRFPSQRKPENAESPLASSDTVYPRSVGWKPTPLSIALPHSAVLIRGGGIAFKQCKIYAITIKQPPVYSQLVFLACLPLGKLPEAQKSFVEAGIHFCLTARIELI